MQGPVQVAMLSQCTCSGLSSSSVAARSQPSLPAKICATAACSPSKAPCPLTQRSSGLRLHRHTARAAESERDTDTRPNVPDTVPAKSSSSSSQPSQQQQQQQRSSPLASQEEEFSWQEFLRSELPKKLGILIGLIAFSRLGVYIRIPGVDVDAFAATMQNNGLLSYVDALAGGSISKVGIFSLGIVPYINASIVLQLLTAALPDLKKMQREDGPQGRAKFQYYQKLAAFVFAIVQAIGQLTYIRPFVEDFNPVWLAGALLQLSPGPPPGRRPQIALQHER